MSDTVVFTACNSEIKEKTNFRLYKDQKIFFCNETCALKFDDDPIKFIFSKHWKLTMMENRILVKA